MHIFALFVGCAPLPDLGAEAGRDAWTGDGAFSSIHTCAVDPAIDTIAYGVVAAADGAVWAIVGDDLFRYEPQFGARCTLVGTLIVDGGVSRLTTDPEGHAWALTRTTIRRFGLDGNPAFECPQTAATSTLVLSEDRLWTWMAGESEARWSTWSDAGCDAAATTVTTQVGLGYAGAIAPSGLAVGLPYAAEADPVGAVLDPQTGAVTSWWARASGMRDLESIAVDGDEFVVATGGALHRIAPSGQVVGRLLPSAIFADPEIVLDQVSISGSDYWIIASDLGRSVILVMTAPL